MTTDFEITDKELREVYELLTKEQLIEALIRKHKECRDIAKNCAIPAVMVKLPENHVCRYSKAMNQPYPRLCVDCGKPEVN